MKKVMILFGIGSFVTLAAMQDVGNGLRHRYGTDAPVPQRFDREVQTDALVCSRCKKHIDTQFINVLAHYPCGHVLCATCTPRFDGDDGLFGRYRCYVCHPISKEERCCNYCLLGTLGACFIVCCLLNKLLS